MLRILSAGESHGKCLIGILEGIHSNLPLSCEDINKELKRRQVLIGRSQRMLIEEDKVEILSGVRFGKTLGSPISFKILNKDWENWKEVMSIEPQENLFEKILTPRPGHADLSGVLKYNFEDIRNVLERASARETAVRVAAGAICKKLLSEFKIEILSWVRSIGDISLKINTQELNSKELKKIFLLAEKSPLRCPDKETERKIKLLIEKVKNKGDTLGGTFEVVIIGLPPGLGTYVQWDRRLDVMLTSALISIPSVKGVEIGLGFEQSKMFGSEVHDEIFFKKEKGFYRKKNNAGGIEGGISNGEPVILRCVAKPIPTLSKPLKTINIKTKKQTVSFKERADICAVSSASVIGESVVAIELVRCMKEKFSGDSLEEMKCNFENYIRRIKT